MWVKPNMLTEHASLAESNSKYLHWKHMLNQFCPAALTRHTCLSICNQSHQKTNSCSCCCLLCAICTLNQLILRPDPVQGKVNTWELLAWLCAHVYTSSDILHRVNEGEREKQRFQKPFEGKILYPCLPVERKKREFCLFVAPSLCITQSGRQLFSVCACSVLPAFKTDHSNSHVLVFKYDALALMLRVVLRGMQCHNQSGCSSCRQATSHWDDTVLSRVLVMFIISALWLHLTNQGVFSVIGGHCQSSLHAVCAVTGRFHYHKLWRIHIAWKEFTQ